MASFGVHHEWDRLKEVVVGIAPAEDLVVFHEHSQRWLAPPVDAFSRKHTGRRLVDIDAARAKRIERQVEGLVELLTREGVAVHRPQALDGAERTFLAPNAEGCQLFVRDAMIVVAEHVIDASLRLRCRQRERFGLRPIVQQFVQYRGARWSSVPLGSPAGVDGPFLEGGDVLLNGDEVYVGLSGCASDLAGADWLQALLGASYRVIPVAMRSNVLHLDWVLGLIKPGLLVHCPQKLIDGLPMSLRGWDKIEVAADEAHRLATQSLVLDEERIVVEADNSHLIAELRRRRLDVLPLPFDAAIDLGGGLRSVHQPLRREGLG